MDNPDKKLSELVGIVKSWIPRRTDPANVSRDFWMPDNSCRVCYECDAQFTVFNRRHHCRLCGRVFCAKCTTNSIPVQCDEPKLNREECERIRVCNFCFKQWEQEIASVNNGIQLSSPGLSPSPSAASLASSKSSGTGNSSISSAGSMPYSTGPYQRVSHASANSPGQSPKAESSTDNQDIVATKRIMDHMGDIGDPSPNPFEYCINRSESEDDEYGAYQSDSETRHFSESATYYGPVAFEEMNHGYGSPKVHPEKETVNTENLSHSLLQEGSESQELEGVEKRGEVEFRDNVDEGRDSSLFGDVKGLDAEPVDFESNALLWLPPEPEDEDDEKDLGLCAEDDDEDTTSEWGRLRSSNSFGSGENRTRDKSTEEHKKAMKNVVDGHFRALVAQLLQVDNLPVGDEGDKESWLEIITTLSWEAATHLKPDTSKGGGMDPGGYVKVKCLACGRRSESAVIKGIVCKKNVAHRRMTSKIEKARLLILGGALEYQRVSNHLSSFDTLLQQEMDHLKMAVTKIDSQHPNILLVEKSVSRYAQEYLLAKDISLVLNIKRPLLDRIARCTGAQIVPSIDHISSSKLGYCEMFHVEKFLEEHGSAGQDGKKLVKTLMFFEGCPKPLGCTILLKGANGEELKKVKHVIQYGVFAAYHLALETSFLADEGASLLELPLKSPLTVALPEKPSSIGRSISTIPGFNFPASGKSQGPQRNSEPERNNQYFSSDSVFQNDNPVLSKVERVVSLPSLKDPDPQHAAESFNSLASFSSFSPSGQFLPSPSNEPSPNPGYGKTCKLGLDGSLSRTHAIAYNELFSGDHYINDSLRAFEQGKQVSLDASSDYDASVKNQPVVTELSSIHHDGSNNQEELGSSKEEFPPSPSDHQSILVSLSTRCVWKGTVCERAHLLRIKYYVNFDMSLGSFLRYQLFDQDFRCRSCELPSEAHVHCYTHQQGSLTISVKKLPDFPLPGERDGKIWMWHRCLRCPRTNGYPPATRRVVMSDAAWGLSFGKFLELSFSNNAAASRVATCGHSLHRDCLRFFGFGRMVACFRYASIDVHSVYLPPPKLDFNYDKQDWIEREAEEVIKKANLIFGEILDALVRIAEKRVITGSPNSSTKIAESRQHIAVLEGMLQKDKVEFEESIQNVLNQEARKGQPAIDILEINRLRRKLLFQSYAWDKCLIDAASSDGINVQDGLSGSIQKTMEKSSSLVDKPVEAKGLTNCDSSSMVGKPFENPNQVVEVGDHPNHLDSVHQVMGNDQDRSLGNEVESRLTSSISLGDQPDSLQSGMMVRRVHSEGQLPVVANLSDTLDAAWTGENNSVSVSLKEDGSLTSDAFGADSSSMQEPVYEKAELKEHSEERGLSEATCSLEHPQPAKAAEIMDGSTSWIGMPFLNFYRSFDKNSSVSSPKLDTLSDYDPVYVTSFRELKHQGGARLLLPVGINDTVVPIYDDEPTSIIAYTLVSQDYHAQMSEEREWSKDSVESLSSFSSGDAFHSVTSFDDTLSESLKSIGPFGDGTLSLSGSRSSLVMDPLLYNKAVHVRVCCTDGGPLGKVKYTVTCYFARQFDALRRTCCPSELDFVRSLSRCKKWGAQGGKSNVFFAKSLDDRFIVKQVTKTELESFIKFAPEYFNYLSESISTRSPTCLAKILGIYQVISKHLKGGKETRMDVLVMENLLFRRNVTKLYDLKGSSRSRYNPDQSGSNKVLLDQNLIESMLTSPIFVGNKAKRLLERAVWNDTSFLASIDVMDYSLLVGVDKEKHELVLGIIDFVRQYTWDKHLETWVKASGILGGPKNVSPTVISPKQYKKRFRKAMSAYFLMVPDQWSPPSLIPSGSQSDLFDDNSNTQGTTAQD
ncbi:hypothetical protein Scep_025073 [Stephania cephalantha]|uniref:1-phosphatidylinositol-3-phosphate 5-kinase n=1 Tax=Stephania cephalantha TaxID=152367 RepID=A0AAP0F325_9MAGN